MTYKMKLKIFSLISKFFYFFGFQIFYSKKEIFPKNLNIKKIIDVGVASGTEILLKNYPNAKYYLIEPNESFFKTIENQILKKYKGKLFKCGADKFNGFKKLFIYGVSSSFYKRKNIKYNTYKKIRVFKLDTLLKNEKISKNTLLKIDTEGNELNILKGSTKILKKINYLMLEVRLKNIETYNPSELISFCHKYKFFWDKVLEIYYVKNGISYFDLLLIKKK